MKEIDGWLRAIEEILRKRGFPADARICGVCWIGEDGRIHHWDLDT